MAKKGPRTQVDRAVRELVEEIVDRRLDQVVRGRALADELRELRQTVARLEKRVEGGGGRAAGRAVRGRPGRPPTHTTCTVPGCTNPHYALGLCSKHYQQRRRDEAEAEAGGGKKKGRTKKATKKSARKSTKKSTKKATKKRGKKAGRKKTTRRTASR